MITEQRVFRLEDQKLESKEIMIRFRSEMEKMIEV